MHPEVQALLDNIEHTYPETLSHDTYNWFEDNGDNGDIKVTAKLRDQWYVFRNDLVAEHKFLVDAYKAVLVEDMLELSRRTDALAQRYVDAKHSKRVV